ncbi:MAG: hypothetical protein QN174_07820 [Armatimonadota bacterium]|nr:hypothetical protein [Armatimonadota bacterium]
MPLQRGEITIDTVTIEAEPFEWPRSAWEMLELRVTERTGWARLSASVVASLRALYNGAHGSVEAGLRGLIVQYAAGTGSAPFAVTDWRGNTGQFVFAPDNGLELQEIHGSGDEAAPLSGGYWTGTIRLVKVG